MWGPGPWGGPMWGFWWIFPLLGLLICAVFAFAMIRAMSGGRGFMCMGGHGQHASDEQAELRREIRELREESSSRRRDDRAVERTVALGARRGTTCLSP